MITSNRFAIMSRIAKLDGDSLPASLPESPPCLRQHWCSFIGDGGAPCWEDLLLFCS
jgi:hypothetical protein